MFGCWPRHQVRMLVPERGEPTTKIGLLIGVATEHSILSWKRYGCCGDLSLTNFLMGRVYVELHRYHQARVHLLRAVDGAEDRAAVLTALATAERGLGNHDAAQIALEEARSGTL